jgi:hypothetical protein
MERALEAWVDMMYFSLGRQERDMSDVNEWKWRKEGGRFRGLNSISGTWADVDSPWHAFPWCLGLGLG